MTPALYVEDGGNLKIVSRHELVEGVSLYAPRKHKNTRPQYGRLPHYYSCPVLRNERRAWAIKHRKDIEP